MQATYTELPRHTVKSGALSKWAVHITYNHPQHTGCYGYFEHDEQGEGGGLWFAKGDDGKWELTDYDGVSELPRSIVHTLTAAGFSVDKDF